MLTAFPTPDLKIHVLNAPSALASTLARMLPWWSLNHQGSGKDWPWHLERQKHLRARVRCGLCSYCVRLSHLCPSTVAREGIEAAQPGPEISGPSQAVTASCCVLGTDQSAVKTIPVNSFSTEPSVLETDTHST